MQGIALLTTISVVLPYRELTEIKDGLNNATSFTYDTENRVTKITDALAREFTYTFDAINQTKTWVFPDSNQESYDYDANGNLTKVTRRGGQETTFSYDDADRLSGKTWVGTTSTVFTPAYDDANRLTGLTKVEGGTTISQVGVTYNAANQVTAVTAEGNTASYAYDAAQRLNQITYPSAEVVKYGFNSRGALESLKNGSNAAIADYTFDDAGRVTKKTLPNGLETVYEYNDANWVTKITLRQTANPSTVLQSFEYGYNKVGNRTWVKYATGSGDVYKYDGTDQLIGVKYGVGNPQDGYDLATGESRVVTYTYDALGNRSVMVDNLTMTNYTVNNLNQYTQVDLNSYSYDTNGNLTGDGTWTFGYDREGHLISANRSGMSVNYKYDAMGRRIEKNVNGTVTKYAYSGQDLIEERDGSNNITAKYVYAGGIDKPVKAIKGSNTFYFQQDALGNVSALTNTGGAIVESYTYDAFGKPTIKDGSGNVISTPSTPFLFTGREFDAEAGLYHYRTRAYSPNLGRFLQMDSIGLEGGDLNFYRYAVNDPGSKTDPNGTTCKVGDWNEKELQVKASPGGSQPPFSKEAQDVAKDVLSRYGRSIIGKIAELIGTALAFGYSGGTWGGNVILKYQCCQCKNGTPTWVDQTDINMEITSNDLPQMSAFSINDSTSGSAWSTAVSDTKAAARSSAKESCKNAQ